MGKKIDFAPEKIQAILEAYRDRSKKTDDICKEFNLSTGMLARILHAENEPMRCPNKSKPHNTKTKTKKCPKCYKKIEVKGARFCPYCGADVRNENEVLAERVGRMLSYHSFMPSNIRDEYIEVLNQVIKNLKG